MAYHPDKHVREAIKYAKRKGWRIQKASGQAHIWGKLLCPLSTREGCYFYIHSTPQNPQNHAKRIYRAIDRCQHS